MHSKDYGDRIKVAEWHWWQSKNSYSLFWLAIYSFFHEEMSFSTHKWPPYNKGMMLGISRHIVTSSSLYLSAVMVANIIFCQLNVFNSIYCSCDIKPLFEGTFSFVLTKMIQLNQLCTMQVFLWLELGGHREHHTTYYCYLFISKFGFKIDWAVLYSLKWDHNSWWHTQRETLNKRRS